MTAMRSLTLGAAVAAVLALSGPATAAPHGVKVGILTCHVASGWGYVVGSSKNMECDYHPDGHQDDRYSGSISKFGVDIGYTDRGTLIWDVVAPSSDVRPGALEGNYAGATASATVGAGVGANVLIGGLDKSIALQPVSVEGNTGLDVSAGVGAISLRADRPMRESAEVPQRVAQADVTPPPAPPEAAASAPPRAVAPHRRHVVHYKRKHHRCTCRD